MWFWGEIRYVQYAVSQAWHARMKYDTIYLSEMRTMFVKGTKQGLIFLIYEFGCV